MQFFRELVIKCGRELMERTIGRTLKMGRPASLQNEVTSKWTGKTISIAICNVFQCSALVDTFVWYFGNAFRLKSLTGRNYVERSVIKALENKIAIYAIHTALDNDLFGVNYRICKELDNADEVEQAIFDAGAGHIGFYDQCRFKLSGEGSFRPLDGANPRIGSVEQREYVEEAQLSFVFETYKKNKILAAMKAAHPYEEVAYQIYSLENDNQYEGLGQYGELKEETDAVTFLSFVKEKFGLDVIRHSKIPNRKIKKVGVLGGSGASELNPQ
ncbi:hypothetical protein FQR65_LT17872 [Abscondita terminalis]|nr:hypothetical protein FQR65_LT17872 [Abscondita terminalis]